MILLVLNPIRDFFDAVFGALGSNYFGNIGLFIIFLFLIANFIYSIRKQDAIIKRQNSTRDLLYSDRKDMALNSLIDNLFRLTRSIEKNISKEEKDAIWTYFNDKFKKFIDTAVELYECQKQDCRSKNSKIELIDEGIFNTLEIVNDILEKANEPKYVSFYGRPTKIENPGIYKDMLDFVNENGTEEQKKQLKKFRIS